MKTYNFKDPEGRELTVNSPDGSVPSESELDTMFSRKFGGDGGLIPSLEGVSSPSVPSSPDFKNPSQPSQLQEDSNPLFARTDAIEPSPSQEEAPLNLSQNIMLGLIPDNPEAKARYLQKEFGGAKITQDEEGGLLVNGSPINLKGMDMRDISQNAGYSLNFLAQVFGSMAGAAAVAPTVPLTGGTSTPGMIAAGMAAGTAANSVADLVRTSIGRALGAPTETDEQLSSMGEEAKIAAIGEMTGLGLSYITKPMIKATAKFFGRGLKLAGDKAPSVAEFIGGISPDETAVILNPKFGGVDKTLSEKTMHPNRVSEIIKKVFFGERNEKIPNEVLFGKVKGANNLERGKIHLVESIKDVADDNYDNLIQSHTGLTKESIDTIKKNSLSSISNPSNYDPSTPFSLANEVLERSEKSLETLGKNIAKIEGKALDSKGGYPFQTSDLHSRLKLLMKETGLMKGIKVSGQEVIPPPSNIPGASELSEMMKLLESKVTKSDHPNFGKVLPVGSLGNPFNLKQASLVSKRMDLLVDKIATGKAHNSIKSAAFQFAKEFRERYQTMLGLKTEKTAYSEMKKILFDSQLDRTNAVSSLTNRIKSYASTPAGERGGLDAFLNMIDPSGKITNRIELSNLGADLGKMDLQKSIEGFEKVLRSPDFIDQSYNSTREQYYRLIDDSLSRSSPGRKFVDDAQIAQAANSVLSKRPNVMRLNTVGSILNRVTMGGTGAVLGNAIGGPLGAISGVGTAMAATSPTGIKAMLKLAEKLQRASASHTANMAKPVAKGTLSKILDLSQAALISSGLRKDGAPPR